MAKPAPPPQDDDTLTATAALRADHVRSSRLRLLVVGEGVYATHPLPEVGDLIIGRSNRADICIDDPAISRRHAVLHIRLPESEQTEDDLSATTGTGHFDADPNAWGSGSGGRAPGHPLIQVEDLGSANGVRVRDTKLVPHQIVEVVPGDHIDLGSTSLIVQRAPTVPRLRRLWTHGAFEARLEDECARSERSGHPFGVLRIHIEGALPPPAVQQTLGEELRSGDVIAMYGPNEYEVIMFDAPPDKADELASRVTSGLVRLGVSVRVGIACYPRDGRAPEELVAKACAAVRDLEEDRSAGPPVVVPDGAMLRLQKLIKRIASGTISVLLLGETGVGKEVMAETIHRESPRAARPLLRLNCAALSEQLLESELFGHERGAFTGAVVSKPGLLETAQGGTVFLDELGEMPLSTQAKLLRVLEDRQVQRVGSLKPKPIDVRFIAATNRDLEAEIAVGRFRQDLYFRLNGIALTIPPLRERVDEIEGLARAFIAHACQGSRRASSPNLNVSGAPPSLSPQALALLRSYAWPGNIRELRNVIERAVLLCTDGVILPEHLPVEKMGAVSVSVTPWNSRPSPAVHLAPLPRPNVPAYESRPSTLPPPPFDRSSASSMEGPPTSRPPPPVDDGRPTLRPGKGRDADERERILAALDRCAGNQTKAARLLGISRRTLVARLEEYNLPRPRKNAPG